MYKNEAKISNELKDHPQEEEALLPSLVSQYIIFVE